MLNNLYILNLDVFNQVYIQIIIIFAMKKEEKKRVRNAENAHFKSIACLLESSTPQGIPDVTEEQIEALAGQTTKTVLAEAGTVNDNVENKETTASSKPTPKSLKVENENLEEWFECVKKRPSIKVERKRLVHFDCDLLDKFMLLSNTMKIPTSKIVNAIVEDWFKENEIIITELISEQLKNVLKSL